MLASDTRRAFGFLPSRVLHATSINDGHATHLTTEHDEAYLKEDEVEIAVQVMGKLRGTVRVPADASKEEVLAATRAEEDVARYLAEATVRKEIVVPGRLVNFVVG